MADHKSNIQPTDIKTNVKTSNELKDCGYNRKEKIGNGINGDIWSIYRDDSKTASSQQLLALKEKVITDAANDMPFIETDIMSRFRHPNIISLTELLLPNNKCKIIGLVMPLGISTLNDNKSLSEDIKINYIFQALCAVNFLHRNGVVHCDIKPDNFVVMADKTLKIIDFGLSRYINQYEDDNFFRHLVYTSIYRPPEIYNKRFFGSSADIWALGITFLSILTGDKWILCSMLDINLKQSLEKVESELTDKMERWPKKRGDTTLMISKVLTGRLFNNKLSLITELITDMILYSPTKRATAEDLLKRQPFIDLKLTEPVGSLLGSGIPKILYETINKLQDQDKKIINKILLKLQTASQYSKPQTQFLAVNLFYRITLSGIFEDISLEEIAGYSLVIVSLMLLDTSDRMIEALTNTLIPIADIDKFNERIISFVKVLNGVIYIPNIYDSEQYMSSDVYMKKLILQSIFDISKYNLILRDILHQEE